ncbi:MAG: hypothetical protein KAW17_09520 [Candidatus Eisenbacteria sp.]|nr:hypothetical protein [Candidatus Eisenbacteria bacterium]
MKVKKNAVRERAKKELARLSEAMATRTLNTEQWDLAYAMVEALEWVVDPRPCCSPVERLGRRNVPEPDPEILAMRRVFEGVRGLTDGQKHRVVSWLKLRLTDKYYDMDNK